MDIVFPTMGSCTVHTLTTFSLITYFLILVYIDPSSFPHLSSRQNGAKRSTFRSFVCRDASFLVIWEDLILLATHSCPAYCVDDSHSYTSLISYPSLVYVGSILEDQESMPVDGV